MKLPTGFKTFIDFYDYIKSKTPNVLEENEFYVNNYSYDDHGNLKNFPDKYNTIEFKAKCFDELEKNRPTFQQVQTIKEQGGYMYDQNKVILFNNLLNLSIKSR